MPPLLSIPFWLYFLYFFIACFLGFYIPGNLFVKRLKLKFFEESVLSTILGIVLLALQGFVFGNLNLRVLTYAYLILAFLLWLRSGGHKYLKESVKKIKIDRTGKIISGIIIIGSLIQLSTIWANGLFINNVIYFCCGLPDTLFSLTLTHELINHFPPGEPAIYGVALHNYHFLANLAVADLIRVFRLPEIATQFQYLSAIVSVLLGLSALTLANILKLSNRFKLWFLILLYFTGSLLFLLSLITQHTLDFSVTTLENASSLWISTSRMYALVIFLGGLGIFAAWIKKKDMLSGMIMALILGSLIGFKVYIGIIALAGLAILGVYCLLKRKFKLIIPFLLTVLISLILYIPVNKLGGGLLFSGFWRFEDFAAQPNLGLTGLELARRIYLDHFNFLHAYLFDLLFGCCYLFFSAGVLMLGFLQSKKSLKIVPFELNIYLIASLFVGMILGFFFLQNPGGANSSQFLIVIYIIGSFYAALALSHWIKKINPITISLCLMIFLLTSTQVFHDSLIRINNITKTNGLIITKDELASYTYFKSTKDDGAVLITNNTGGNKCLLLVLFGDKKSLSCMAGAPGDRGVDLSKRLRLEQTILESKDTTNTLAKQNSIKYIYDADKTLSKNQAKNNHLIRVFQNPKASIYKIL